jgi:c-di-GMP-binding flagellar brake protein YcgR
VFFWKKASARRAGALQRATITETQRKNFRASVEFSVLYDVTGRTGPRTALANDLSAGGLRLVGDEDLPNDTLLSVRFTLPNELVRGVQLEREIVETTARGKVKRKIMVPPEPFREMIVHGKIVIAFYSPRRRKFAHGVQFIDIDERTREEIQRFIHVWQIRLLRERRLLRGE